LADFDHAARQDTFDILKGRPVTVETLKKDMRCEGVHVRPAGNIGMVKQGLHFRCENI